MTRALGLLLLLALVVEGGLMVKVASKRKNMSSMVVVVVREVRARRVMVTAYAATKRQTDSTPRLTALMARAKEGRTCAISRDLVREGWLGRRIYIEGLGVWVAEDVMNKRWRNRIDLLLPLAKAKKFTPREAWAVVID